MHAGAACSLLRAREGAGGGGGKGQVTKNDLIDAVALSTGYGRPQVKKMVETALEVMLGALERGERVEFRNFGAFGTRMRKGRKAHNPRTLAKIDVPAKRVVYFRPGKGMKERVR